MVIPGKDTSGLLKVEMSLKPYVVEGWWDSMVNYHRKFKQSNTDNTFILFLEYIISDKIMPYPLFPLNCYSLADWPRSRNITRTKSLFMYHYVAHK